MPPEQKPDASNSFFVAIITGDLDEVKAIFPEHPQALSWVTPAGYPPLHMALLNQRRDIAVWLVEQGADLRQSAMGETAEKLADRKGMLQILREAEKRQGECRSRAVAACAERMHAGLEIPISVARKPLKLRPKGPS
jgi:hypothetical protein